MEGRIHTSTSLLDPGGSGTSQWSLIKSHLVSPPLVAAGSAPAFSGPTLQVLAPSRWHLRTMPGFHPVPPHPPESFRSVDSTGGKAMCHSLCPPQPETWTLFSQAVKRWLSVFSFVKKSWCFHGKVTLEGAINNDDFHLICKFIMLIALLHTLIKLIATTLRSGRCRNLNYSF